MMRLPAAIGFDLGDTLCEYAGVALNWERQYPAALARVAECCAQRLTAERLQSGTRVLSRYNTRQNPREREHAAEQIFSELFAEWSAPPERLADGIAAFFAHFRQSLRAFPEATSVLQRLHALGVPLGVLTDVPYGMPRALVLADLAETALPIADSRLLTSTTVGYRKPHPAGFLALARELGAPCERMAYIGNEQKDIDGAKAAGCRAILLWRSPHPAPSWGQAHTVSSLEALFELPLAGD